MNVTVVDEGWIKIDQYNNLKQQIWNIIYDSKVIDYILMLRYCHILVENINKYIIILEMTKCLNPTYILV